MAAKDIAVRGPILSQGVLQGARDMLLPDHVREGLRSVFASENLIAHGRNSYLIIREARSWVGAGARRLGSGAGLVFAVARRERASSRAGSLAAPGLE